MKQFASLLWKEWHETHIYLLIGLGIFLGLPCIGGVEAMFQFSHRFEIRAAGWVLAFGGVFAILVAVGETSRDLSGHLEDFWRSRPVDVVQWFLTKYVVGLAITLLVCGLPILLEQVANVNEDINLKPIALASFMWTAFYTLAFAAGCLIRRPAHAAIMALTGLLLVHCVPLVMPQLGMNAFEVIAHFSSLDFDFSSTGALMFAAGMSVITIAMLTLAIAAVRYHWHVVASRRLMYGAVFGTFLIIIGTAGHQIGTNLPVLQQLDLNHDEFVERVVFDGERGDVITARELDPRRNRGFDSYIRLLTLTPSGLVLGQPAIAPGAQYFTQLRFRGDVALVPGHSDMGYCAINQSDDRNDDYRLVIRTSHSNLPLPPADGLKLWNEQFDPHSLNPLLQIWKNHLFAIGNRLVTVDIIDPLDPQVISNVPFSFQYITPQEPAAFALMLPRVPGLPKEQRLEAATRGSWGTSYFPDDHILCQRNSRPDLGSRIIAWRLRTLTDDVATFEPIGEYAQSFLENLFGNFAFSQMTMRDGWLYAVSSSNGFGNGRVSVFDLHSPHPLQPVAHFAAPGAWVVCPLSDGRALIGGSKLWLVGPPPSRKH